MHKTIATLLLLVGAALWTGAYAADKKAKATETQNFPIATQTLLDGVKSTESKGVIKSVLMIQCPKDNGKGTGFVLSGGSVITTNAHVVGTCSAEDLVGISSVIDEPVKFASVEKDPSRDLALLCTTKPLPFSLALKGDENPPVETEVETWGYPLRYQDSAPVLSRGYVAGYTTKPGTSVKHLIINGALNPGNSGGPLIDRTTGKVIGIVVEKWNLFSPLVETVINGLQHSAVMTGGGFQTTDANGVPKGIPNEVAVALALKEIYDKSQVMMGEAISVSELNAFIKEKRQGLACASP
jgi:S1-C subfamily serine protease